MKKNLLFFGAGGGQAATLLADAAKGLDYLSETDAEIVPFRGDNAESVTAAEVLRQTGRAADEPVEMVDPDVFFDRLTAVREWYGEMEMVRAKGFAALYEELKRSLTDLHVFRIGRIQIEIYIAGLDADGRLAGVATRAVET